MKTKIFALLAVLVLAFSILTGCGGDDTSDTQKPVITDGEIG